VIPVLSHVQALLGPFQGAGRDFSGEDFSGRDLRGANFEGASLNGCIFDDACLEGANLCNAQAADASFQHVKANGMQAQGLQACGSKWYFAALDNADFSDATLCNSRFTDITGSDCCIKGADLGLAVLDASTVQVMQPPPHSSLVAPLGELTPLWRRPLSSEYADLAFSRSGKAMVATDMCGGVSIWHSRAGIRARVWVDSQVSLHAVFLPCERRLLTANMAGQVKIWNVLSGECLQQWQAHDHPVHALALSLCGQWLATADLAGNLKCWNVFDAALVAQMHWPDRQISRLMCGPEVAKVWVSFVEGGAALCDCVNQVEKNIPELAQKGVLAFAGESGSPVALVKSVSGTDVCRLTDQGVRTLQSNIVAHGVVLSPDGHCLLVVYGDRSPQLLHITDGHTQSLPHAPVEVREAAFSSDGRQLVLINPSRMQWLDTTTGHARITHELPYPRDTNRGWHWLPDGKRIATHQHAIVLDAMQGLSQNALVSRRFIAEETRSHCFGVHPNGQAVFSLTTSRTDTSNAICSILDFFAHMFDPSVSHMSGTAISQDGRHALFEYRRTLRVWSLFDVSGDQTAIAPHASCDMHSTPELADIVEQGVTRSTALANGGCTVASGTREGEIVVIDMLIARQSLRWQAHAGSVSAICFIDGQKRLLSFCTDGESLCCLWSVENGELLQTWLWPHAAPLSVQVGPTGDVLVQADVVVVLDGASLCAPCAELKVRFSCRTGRDGSVMTLHTDGTYSATGMDACYLGLTYQGAGGVSAVKAPAWPRFWNALDVVDRRSQCDPESIKRHSQATEQPL
jgi:WD40 repeat protein